MLGRSALLVALFSALAGAGLAAKSGSLMADGVPTVDKCTAIIVGRKVRSQCAAACICCHFCDVLAWNRRIP
jgi:hypothetical protein